MSELQAVEAENVDLVDVDQNEIEIEHNADAERDEAPPESAPGPEGNQDKKPEFTEEQRAYMESVIGKKAFKAREAERKAKELEEKLAELERKIPSEARPVVPAFPDDPYAEDFQEQVAARDEAIRKAAEFDARQNVKQAEQERLEQERLQAKQAQIQRDAQAYEQKAKSLNIDRARLERAEQTIGDYGIAQDVAGFLLSHSDGPQIVQYIGENISALEEVASLSPMRAAVYIESVIKPAATKTSKKVPSAPDPVQHDAGTKHSGVNSVRYGATFE